MNYGEIKADFVSILNRDDITDAQTVSYISKSLSRVHRKLRTPAMEKVYEVAAVALDPDYSFAIPADYLQAISISVDGGLPLILQDERTFKSRNGETGTPLYYCRIGPRLYIRPYAAADVTMWYHSDSVTLVDDEDSNVLTDTVPDLVVYGALSSAADFWSDERGQLFEGRFQQILEEIEEQARMAEFAGSSMQVEPLCHMSDYE